MKKSKTTRNRVLSLGSLYQWALLGFVIVTLPLVFAIVYATIEVTNYTEQSQKTLFQTINSTESSRIILERLVSMERSIRQYQVLNELDLFKSYLEHREKFLDVLETLKSTAPNNQLSISLNTLQQNENQLYQDILSKSEDNQPKLTEADLNSFDSLTIQVRAILKQGERKVWLETSALSVIANQVRHRLVILALASIPLALLLGLVFVYLLTRPLKKMGLAIRNLGEVGFDQPITIHGPKDLAELGQHLEWLRQKLNQLEHEKQQFIRNISHELKTPLASIKEGTDLLADNIVGKLNTEQQEIIQLMKMSNIAINDLVENLLEYQRTLATQVDLDFTEFELGHLLNRIIEEYQLPLRSKNITLKKDLKTVYIAADYDKLKIIISNIFSNALKFSPLEGEIGISLNAGHDHVAITIEDQGPGIAEDIKALIFKDFYQGVTPQAWSIKGSGLGLALVNYYLVAHKGTIKLLPASNDFGGARFSLVLPINKEAFDATIA